MTRRWKDTDKQLWITAYPCDDPDRTGHSRHSVVAFSPKAARSIRLTHANVRKFAAYLLNLAGSAAPA